MIEVGLLLLFIMTVKRLLITCQNICVERPLRNLGLSSRFEFRGKDFRDIVIFKG